MLTAAEACTCRHGCTCHPLPDGPTEEQPSEAAILRAEIADLRGRLDEIVALQRQCLEAANHAADAALSVVTL